MPRMKWCVGLVLCGCISPVMHFGEGKSAKQAQHDTLGEFLPATLDTTRTYTGPIREAKVIVYADDEYRAQNLKWEQTFGEQIDRANSVLGPQFGLHLTADYHEWAHHAPGNGLPEDLEELDKLDAGDHAFAVIGLTSALGLVSATFELLGYASVGGNHIMLRGNSDLEERKAFEASFPDLPAEERANAYEVRRRHKTAAVLLHELGHNLGMNHEEVEDTLMSSRYSEHSTAFSATAHETIQRTIDRRLGGGVVTAAAAPASTATKVHPKVVVHITATEVLIDDKPEEPGPQIGRFSAYAAMDPETEVIIHKDKGVPTSAMTDVIDRAKSQGLTRFSIQ